MWYVIQVSTGSEVDIAKRIREAGMKAVVPRENKLIRKGGEWNKKEYTLFPGYIFLDIDFNAENYYKLKAIPGVVQFLGDNSAPSTLSHMEVEWIRLLSGKDDAPIEPTVVRVVNHGELEIVSGVLENFTHRLIKIDKRQKKATFEITICGETKIVQLSVIVEDEEAERNEEREFDDFSRPQRLSDESPL